MPSSQNEHLLMIEKVLLLKSLNIFSETPENVLADLAPLMQEIEIYKSKTTLAILKEKEVFGELSLIDAETRSASARAHTDCYLFKIDQDPFFELLDSRPEIAKGFLKMLCKRLRILNEKFDKERMQ
jgi:CRP/FNR family cyclic AMP-dependent transcriptional regulator